MKIKHLSVRSIADNNVFTNVKCYDDLINNIIQYGESFPPEEYEDRVGEALEVYAEFWLTRYGQLSNPNLGVLDVMHTSTDKFQPGFDFNYTDFDKLPGHIQVKFRRNPEHKFTRSDLGNFISKADEEEIPAPRRILFSNQNHSENHSIFHFSYTGGPKQMRVLDRSYQETYIDRDPTFWDDLNITVIDSGKAPTLFVPLRKFRQYQQRLYDGWVNHRKTGGNRGRAVCATGGGKTELIFQAARNALLYDNANLVVVVAPTIDLLRQHHDYFEQFGIFHTDKVAVVHFRTGDEARQDDYIDYTQTTSKDPLLLALNELSSKKIIIFVTYASIEHLCSIMTNNKIVANIAFWDEFQHCVVQTDAYKEFLLNVPFTDNLFLSASHKRGRIVSSLDETIFGPLVGEVTHAELVQLGILVPKIIIKPIRISSTGARIQAIAHDLKKAALREDFDLREAVTEAAACIVARNDMIITHQSSNIITFSKSVPICKALIKSDAVRAELVGATLQTVHASVPARDRKKAYENVRQSKDSILLQHSVVKEGIDVTAFNSSVVSRGMDVIGTQQGPIGRTVRAHPDDTIALTAGQITLDSPVGWKKPSATIFLIMYDTNMDNYLAYLKQFILKLHAAGLTESDYQFGEITEQRTGIASPNDANVPIINDKDLFGQESLRDVIARMQIELEEEERFVNAELEFSKMSHDEKIANCLTF